MHHSTADNPVQAAGAVAQVYARSAYNLAVQAGGSAVPDLQDELNQVVDLMRDHPKLRTLLTDAAISAGHRAASIANLFRDRAGDLTYRLLQVLNDKDRLDQLPGIALAYAQIVKAERGEIDVEVYAAAPLAQGQIDRIADRIGAMVGRKAIVHPHVDESMIGGLKVRVGDQLIDASVVTQLRKLRERLLDRGRQAVRAGVDAIVEEG